MKRNIDFENYDERLEQFKSFVSGFNNEDRFDWIRAAGKANHLWNGKNEGLIVFDEWSLSASNYTGYHDCSYTYNSFKNNSKVNKYIGIFDKNNNSASEEKLISHVYDISTPASSNHPYLKSHHVKSYGCRQYGTHLYIPMYNMKGKLITIPSIKVCLKV